MQSVTRIKYAFVKLVVILFTLNTRCDFVIQLLIREVYCFLIFYILFDTVFGHGIEITSSRL